MVLRTVSVGLGLVLLFRQHDIANTALLVRDHRPLCSMKSDDDGTAIERLAALIRGSWRCVDRHCVV